VKHTYLSITITNSFRHWTPSQRIFNLDWCSVFQQQCHNIYQKMNQHITNDVTQIRWQSAKTTFPGCSTVSKEYTWPSLLGVRWLGTPQSPQSIALQQYCNSFRHALQLCLCEILMHSAKYTFHNITQHKLNTDSNTGSKKVKIVNLYNASSRINASNALSSLTRAAGCPAATCSLQTQASAAARPGSLSQLYQGPHLQ